MNRIPTLFQKCYLHIFETEEECNKTVMGICSDLAVNSKIPVAYFTSRHTEVEFCKLLLDHCGYDSVDKLSKSPISIVGNVKTKSIETSLDILIDILSTIRQLVRAKGCKLIILDGFVHITDPFAALAEELNISMLAVDIKNNQ